MRRSWPTLMYFLLFAKRRGARFGSVRFAVGGSSSVVERQLPKMDNTSIFNSLQKL